MQQNYPTQLIPGNPGTSFVVALLYAAHQKYGHQSNNEDQLTLFAQGIIASRNVFFSGICNEIAQATNKKLTILSNSKRLLHLASPEVDPTHITLKHNALDITSVERLLDTYRYVVLSVDLFAFRKYHDYHFVCINRHSNLYEIFEPKQGAVTYKDQKDVEQLIRSASEGLGDISVCFVV